MRKRLTCIIISGLLLITTIARGEDWILIATFEGIQMFVERESIKHMSKNIVRAWRKYQFKEPQEDEVKDYTALSVYSEIDCNEETFKVLQEVIHFTDNTHEAKDYEPSSAQWESVRPKTFDYYFYSYICKER